MHRIATLRNIASNCVKIAFTCNDAGKRTYKLVTTGGELRIVAQQTQCFLTFPVKLDGMESVQVIITKRVKQLGLDQAGLARLVGMSHTSAGQFMAQSKIQRATTTARYCTALGWSPDSIDRILRGEEPELLDQPKEHTATTVRAGSSEGAGNLTGDEVRRIIRQELAAMLKQG
jgi:hypothetical protein